MTSLTPDLSDAFFREGASMGERLHLSFLHMLFAMNFESGIRSSALNPGSNASGLIQLIPDPKKPAPLGAYGFSGTTADFRALSAEAQLPYVERYFQPYAGKGLNSAARIEQALLGPATLDDPSGLIYSATGTRWGGQEASYYAGNKVFDHAGKGSITVDDLQVSLVGAASASSPNGPRFAEAASRYSALTGQPLTTPPSALPVSPSLSHPAVWGPVAFVAGAGVLTLLLANRADFRHTPLRGRTA